MQPPTFRAAPKVGARKPGLQRGAAERPFAALGRKKRGGEGFLVLLLRKRKPRFTSPASSSVSFTECPRQDLTHSGSSVNRMALFLLRIGRGEGASGGEEETTYYIFKKKSRALIHKKRIGI